MTSSLGGASRNGAHGVGTQPVDVFHHDEFDAALGEVEVVLVHLVGGAVEVGGRPRGRLHHAVAQLQRPELQGREQRCEVGGCLTVVEVLGVHVGLRDQLGAPPACRGFRCPSRLRPRRCRRPLPRRRFAGRIRQARCRPPRPSRRQGRCPPETSGGPRRAVWFPFPPAWPGARFGVLLDAASSFSFPLWRMHGGCAEWHSRVIAARKMVGVERG